MSSPQSAILPEPGESALFLNLRVRDRAHDGASAARVAARIPALTAAVAKRDPKRKLVSALGFGPALWDLISPRSRPVGFKPFPRVSPRAPATGGDFLLHAGATRMDLCFELGLAFRRELGDAVEVVEEVQAFRYLDGRDLTGFVEGTENPKGRERADVALIGREDPKFAGGSLMFAQRYVHDLVRWNALSVREQEAAMGRTKRDSRELKGNKAPTAHIARVEIEEDGEELEILRHSLPYGSTSEQGLYFLAYTRDLAIPLKMLRRMLGSAPDGLEDRLMDFTRAISGATFFAPSLAALRRIAAR
jgi:putative iron-dependent peroxidase